MSVHAFVPGYDSCTWANETVANKLPMFSNSKNIIHGQQATRESFWTMLETTKYIFAMSHGDVDILCAQGGVDHAVTLDDIKSDRLFIKDRVLFVWACRTAGKLGLAFRRNGTIGRQGIWWGYPVAVSAPDRQVYDDFVNVFTFVVNAFPLVQDPAGVDKFRENLRAMCEPIYDRLVTAAARSNKFKNLHETAVAFREMYNYLEVSFADGQMVPSIALPLSSMWA